MSNGINPEFAHSVDPTTNKEVIAEVSETEEFQQVFHKDTLAKAKHNRTYNAKAENPQFPLPQNSSEEADKYAEQKRVDSALLFAEIGAAAAIAKQLETEVEMREAVSESKENAIAMALMDREQLIAFVKHDLKKIANVEEKQKTSRNLLIASLVFLFVGILTLSPLLLATSLALGISAAVIGSQAAELAKEASERKRFWILPILGDDKSNAILTIILEKRPHTLPIPDDKVFTIQPEDTWRDSNVAKKLLLSQLLTASEDEIANSPAFETFKQEKDYAALLDQIPIALAMLSEEAKIRKTGQAPDDLFLYKE